ncbi:hypothetical protein PV326_007120 [Microctonus aethiopoides]|nr:hypothetical protein PV326_007120 [Microctonus aethiopoides]
MQKIVKFGFLPVKNDRIRGQNDIKGKKLFESGHVLNVVETEDPNKQSTITCSVVAQTNISNEYNSAASKTSQLQGWGKPSHRQLLVEGVWPWSPVFQVLQFEERNQVEIIAAETLVEMRRVTEKQNLVEKAKKVTFEIFMLQLVNNLYGVECETLKKLYDFYQNKVCCDVDKALTISIGTIDQSQNPDNAYKVKGNRFDVEKVINEFLNPEKVETSAMSYGKKTEELALKKYKKIIRPNWEVVKVCLIINIPQPWVSCSPDSILVHGSNIWETRLIEVKCPYSCPNQPIFDEESLQINIQYLKFDENGLYLSPTHSIYT